MQNKPLLSHYMNSVYHLLCIQSPTVQVVDLQHTCEGSCVEVNYAYISIICTYMCHSDKQIDLKSFGIIHFNCMFLLGFLCQ